MDLATFFYILSYDVIIPSPDQSQDSLHHVVNYMAGHLTRLYGIMGRSWDKKRESNDLHSLLGKNRGGV
jgi:hypothetical protein